MFNYPVFLILYLLSLLYFCRNSFCWLCQQATNIIQKSYMSTDQAFHQQKWNQYRKAARNCIFQKKVLELFGKNRNEDGNYLYKYSTIEDCKIFPSTPALIRVNISELKKEWRRISKLNDWFLVREGRAPVKDVMLCQVYISFKVLTTKTGSGKGLYLMKCEEIWHSLNSKEFRDIFSRTKPSIPAQQFMKQMLRSNSWFQCSKDNCSFNKTHNTQFPMPTKSFNCNALVMMSVYNSDIPIFHMEVTREKMGAEDDKKKLMLTSCWNLCYTSKTFGMEVGKSCITFIQMEKMRDQGTIASPSWIAQLISANTLGRVFDDLVRILDIIITALDASYMQFNKVWDNCQKLLDINLDIQDRAWVNLHQKNKT